MLDKNKILLIGLFLIIPTIIIFLLYYFSLPPKYLSLQKKNEVAENIIQDVEFYDLDNDGITEQIHLNLKKTTPNKVSLLIKNKDVFEEQYNINNVKIVSPPINIFFYDINNDNIKEIFFLNVFQDSIFLSIIDHGNRRFIKKREYLLSKPDSAYYSSWDLSWKIVGFLDEDVQKRFLIFNVNGGHSIYPRSVYKYDLKEQKIIESFNAAIPLNVEKSKFHREKEERLFLSTQSPMNCGNKNIKNKYTDTLGWAFVLDRNLRVLWETSVEAKYPMINLIEDKDNYFLLQSNGVTPFIKNRLYKLDKEFNFVDSLEIKLCSSCSGIHMAEEKIYVYSKRSNEVLSFDKNLNQLSKISLGEGFISKYVLFNKILFLINQGEKLSFYDENFELLFNLQNEISLKYNFLNPISMGYNKNKNEEIIKFNTTEGSIYYLIKKRSFIKYLGFVLGSYLSSYLIIILLIYLYIRFSIYLQTSAISIKYSNRAIFIVDGNLRILFSNKLANEIFNYNSDLNEEIRKQSELFLQFSNVIKEKLETTKEINFTNKEKLKLKMVSTIIPLKLKFNIVGAYLCTLEDQTSIIMKERTKVWFHSMQKIAHEIKTPLSSIMMNIKSIENQISKNEDSKMILSDLDVMKNETKRIKELTINLLKFANLHELNFQEIKLVELFNKSKERFRSYLNRGINLEINVLPEIIIYADSYQMEELFQILIENAIDTMSGEGTIKIIANKLNENIIEISVVDSGIGILHENISKIFEPYFTTKKEGTGMGLAIALKILADHNSKLEVNSELNKGTIFSFKLQSRKYN